MTNLPIQYVIIEGTDCSGKSSLYSSLHKETGFAYNMQDRSFLSMLCYARLYGRDEYYHREMLREEICNANNYIVILMPPKDTILNRLASRGDEFQNEDSIIKLYDIFSEEIEKLQTIPNVLIVRQEMELKNLSKYVADHIERYRSLKPENFGSLANYWVNLSGKTNEIQFSAKYHLDSSYVDNNIMSDPHEGDYYKEILNKCKDIITAEINGNNPYNLPQTLDSRRFYYSSDSCISSIHFLPRDGNLKVICTL
ncbi:MAG: hypothetical protein EBS19_14675, partial [Spirochaetia bacterium]|nr:hypothetical protein [Spirochaetia bacterium]